MIDKYSEFLNEKMILESNIIFSNKFKKVLNRIDHPISNKILDIENKDLDTKNNFFDVEFDKNDKISFIPDAKAQKILSSDDNFFSFTGAGGGWLKHKDVNQKIFDELGYEPDKVETLDRDSLELVEVDSPNPYKPSSVEHGKEISRTTSDVTGKTYVYVQFEDGKGVYNIDKLKLVDGRSKKVWSKNRQQIKVGKGIRAILKSNNIDIEPRDLEAFVNLFKASLDKLNDKFSFFEEVEGEDIRHWYKYTNYFERKGPLGTSCMSNVPPEYFDIYVENPDVCCLLIFKSPDDDTKILGRALLWTLRDGKRFVDRIYTINDSDIQLFRDYAKENGWYLKRFNNSTESDMATDKEGNYVRLNMIVDIKGGDYDSYPYLDTLKYYDPSDGTLSTESTSETYALESVDGSAINCDFCEGRGEVECYYCDGRGEVECHHCDGNREIECYDCYGEGDIECSHCDGEGTIENDEGEEEDCDYCDGKGREDCHECEGSGELDCGECEGRGEYECEECWGRGEVHCYECS